MTTTSLFHFGYGSIALESRLADTLRRELRRFGGETPRPPAPATRDASPLTPEQRMLIANLSALR